MTTSKYKQKQIVKKIVDGLSISQTAKDLKLSRKTVRKYSDKHGVVPRYQKASSPIGYLKDGGFQSRLDPVRIPPYPYRDPYRDEYELPGYADDGYPATDTYKTQNNNLRVRNESMDTSETKTILPTSKPIEEKLVTFDKRLCSLETQQKNNSITSEQLRNSNQQKQALQEKHDTLAQKIYYDQGLRDQNDHMM